VVLKNNIWRLLDSAGSKNQEIRGTNYFMLLFSKKLAVQMHDLSFVFLDHVINHLTG